MRFKIEASMNTDLYNISIASDAGTSKSELKSKLIAILDEIPVGRYILVVGARGYNTAYLKTSEDEFKWMYNNESKKLDTYWSTSDIYVVLPAGLEPSSKIKYEDDMVQVYELFNREDEIYFGEEDYEPMKREKWNFCKDIGIYYIVDYTRHTTYIKRKVED